MENETKMVLSGPGVYHIVNEAPASVDQKDLHLNNVSMAGLLSYVAVRKATILEFNEPISDDGAHLLVRDRDKSITLVLSEHGGIQKLGEVYYPSTTVSAKADFSDDHAAVKKMMSTKWTADNLHKEVRKNRHLFADEQSWKTLWTNLRNTQHEVGRITEATSNDLGARKKGFDEKIVNASPIQWQMTYSIFEGNAPVTLNFEVMYEIVSGDVQLSVVCDEMVLTERGIVKQMMDDTVNSIVATLEGKLPVIRLN